MPIKLAPLSTCYLDEDQNHRMGYYKNVQLYIIETIHLTKPKPYQAPVRYYDPFLCDAVAGWYDLVQDAAEELKHEKVLGDDTFEKCPNANGMHGSVQKTAQDMYSST
jgi:hypothetical protein